MKNLLIKLLLCGFALGVSSVQAQTTTTANFEATATLSGSCVLSTQDISFGTIDLINGPNQTTVNSSISVLCSQGVPYTISGDTTEKDMQGYWLLTGASENPDHIIFDIRHDSAEGFGNGVVWAYFDMVGTGTGELVTHVTRASISKNAGGWWSTPNKSNAEAKPDNYSGIVTATVTY